MKNLKGMSLGKHGKEDIVTEKMEEILGHKVGLSAIH